MEFLKHTSFSIFLFVIGSIFLFLGLSGGFTASGYSLTVQDAWPRILSSIIGGVLIGAAIYLETRAKSTSPTVLAEKPKEKINQDDQKDHELYMHREEIYWPQYNKAVSYRFWACGTSLIGAFERGLIPEYLNKGVKDIKVILPSADSFYASYEQLEKYDQAHFGLVDSQIDLAKKCFDKFETLVPLLGNSGAPRVLKKYGGIMYSNITIFDDDAFIAFYDSTGKGDASFALHFNKNVNKTGYALVEAEFLRMWNTHDSFGIKGKKKVGTSILFVNNVNQILLFLRDNNPNIPFPNCWDILGGGVEAGETPVDCIIREMDEELGIKLENPRVFNIYDLNDRIECTFWQKADFDIRKIVLREGQRPRWFTEKEITKMADKELAFGFKSIILDFFRQKPFNLDNDSNAG